MSGIQQKIFEEGKLAQIGHLCWAYVILILQNTALNELKDFVQLTYTLFDSVEQSCPNFTLGDMLPTDDMQTFLEKLFKCEMPKYGLRLPRHKEALIVCHGDHYHCFLNKGTQDFPDIWRFNSMLHKELVQSSKEEFRELIPDHCWLIYVSS